MIIADLGLEPELCDARVFLCGYGRNWAAGIKNLWLRGEGPFGLCESDEQPKTENISFTRRCVPIGLESLDVDRTQLREGTRNCGKGVEIRVQRSAPSQAFPSVELARIDTILGISEAVDLSVFERVVQLDVDYEGEGDADLLSIHLLRVIRIRVTESEEEDDPI
ncbi:hypothetical protein FB45DRAFT_1090903 [Roridomyces roridus]|uniref:Uncharacterized protein n=1 Tax=Roridomyces roridus TaxID=1738132 RepID=A0AAD7FG59_9AGAR|nr:hypothetical protein FB45DRAFT_1090903 [Roridomyces roridus]